VPGKFDRIHRGAVDGMYNIRHISDTDDLFSLSTGARLQAVYYDADVGFVSAGAKAPVVSGQNADGRVPVQRQLGFIQRLPLPQLPDHPSVAVAHLLSPGEFQELLRLRGPIGGGIDCTIRLGSSDQLMRLTSLTTADARPGPSGLGFAVAAYGSPVLPGNGRWSVVRVGVGDGIVESVDAGQGVPLIRANGGPYRWAEPTDLQFETSPLDTDYALLLAHDAQRMLFQQLKVPDGQNALISSKHPVLADPYRMLHSTGLFPAVDRAIDVGANVPLTAGTLRLGTPLGQLTFKPAAGAQTLVDVSAWADRLEYGAVEFAIDSVNSWQIKISRLDQIFSADLAGDIFHIAHDALSQTGVPSEFGTPSVEFAPAFALVAQVMDMLRQILPGSMRDDDGPLQLTCSIDGTTFHLAAVADYEIADEDGDAVECGMGKLKGHIKLGCELTAELLAAKVHGAVFLEIDGSWQQEIFPLLYGGGELRFAARGDDDGKTTFDLDACTTGSIGGDVVPGLVALEATVKYGYFIRLEGGTFLPGLVVGMEGRAKLLSGLLGFKLTVEGRALISLPGLVRDPLHTKVHLHGDILIAGTVTVAWALKERKSFNTQLDFDLDWKLALLAAKSGLLPVP
jgi:hypothetical protein